MKKGLKIALIVIVVLVALPLVIALFVKKDIVVVREVTINKPKQEVFDYIVQLKNQNNYSVWAQKDPNMKKVFTGTDGTVGFVSAWESEDDHVGAGEQEITAIVPGERVDYELRFKKPFEDTNLAYMTTEAVSETQTKVKWGFKGDMDYPMNLMLLFGMEKQLGDDFQQGLDKLKTILEK